MQMAVITSYHLPYPAVLQEARNIRSLPFRPAISLAEKDTTLSSPSSKPRLKYALMRRLAAEATVADAANTRWRRAPISNCGASSADTGSRKLWVRWWRLANDRKSERRVRFPGLADSANRPKTTIGSSHAQIRTWYIVARAPRGRETSCYQGGAAACKASTFPQSR